MQDSDIKLIISDDKKVEILLNALDERYSATKVIRERVQNICTWALGLFVTSSGYILTSTAPISIHQKAYFTVLATLSVIILRVFYLEDLERGFKSQQQIQAKIENVLGLCKKGTFAKESIYPESWSHAGTNKGKGKFFLHNYILIYSGMFMLILSIWLR
ncbi:hypothetical protein KXQ82_15500 [Mucilaginibacter sp. HMF5004]|uniref:hypothetical protein n=1 Tax=Mucilaginibacter rivuli TaxID=2857527 RepID=UPI001C5F7935|nr:hypothetical protein [Mucilaginibacter rivuli]MBW4891130.1 hypothetical protein [Mucilaginibacter rivuli]